VALIAPFCIGVAGPSCSGKTSIAQRLAAKLPGEVTVFGTDAYYLDLSHLSYAERCGVNFDDPDMLESKLLAEHVADLRRGRPVRRPLYDFATHSRVQSRHETIEPRDFLIVEGLFTLHWPEVRTLFDVSAFVAAPDATCLHRRTGRDVRERGRTIESILAQYDATVRPGNDRYVLPSRSHADLVVNGEDPVEVSAERIAAVVLERASLKRT